MSHFALSDVMLAVMDKTLLFGLAALILNVIGYVPYIREILAGVVKPQRVTWVIWSILSLIAFVNQIINGGGYSIFFVGSTFALTSTVFALSIFKGVGGASKFDLGILAAVSLLAIAWIGFRESYYSTLFVVMIDCLAALPTLVKAYLKPQTEAYFQWVTSGIGGLFGIISLPMLNFILIVYPLYIAIMNGLIVGAKFVGTGRGHAKVKA